MPTLHRSNGLPAPDNEAQTAKDNGRGDFARALQGPGVTPTRIIFDGRL
jgi:hypothetical protein